MTAFFTVARPGTSIVYTTPLYGGTTGLIHSFLEPFGVQGIPVRCGDSRSHRPRHHGRPAMQHRADLETPANPTMVMTDIRRAAGCRRAIIPTSPW